MKITLNQTIDNQTTVPNNLDVVVNIINNNLSTFGYPFLVNKQ